MARLIEAEARISALDATGDTFQAIARKVRGLAGAMKSLGGAASSGAGSVNRTIGRLQGAIHTIAPVARGAAAYEGMRGVSGLIHDMAEATTARAHEAIRMEVAGMSEAEISEAERVSGELSERYKALSTTTVMHALRNMRSIVGTYEEAGKILDPVLKLRISAMGAHPERAAEMAEDFDQLIKGMEIKGVTMDPAKFTSYMQGMAKAINVFGDTLRPTDFYELFKYGRQATQSLSEQFMLETAPTLAQELKGPSAGTAMSSFYQAIVGGRIKEQSVKEMAALGLIDPAHVVRTKTGSIKGLLPGGVKGWRLAASDPYAWTNQVLLPALNKHGINDPQEIQAAISSIFQKATAGQMVGVFATQQARIQKDWNLVKGAKGLEGADTFLSKDPLMAWQSVTEQFKNLLAIAGGPLAGPAAERLNELAAGIVAIEHATKDHPLGATAGVAGAVGLGAYLSAKAGLWALRGAAGLVRSGAGAIEDLSGDAALRVLQAAQAAPKGAPGWLSGIGLAGVLGGVGLGGYELSRSAADSVWANPKAYAPLADKDNPMLGAMSGDFGMAAAIANRTAEVKGSADLNVSVQVEPSESFISRIISELRNEINAFSGGGTAGSTGVSMPEAIPGP